jgi:CheY-like chemotaxis protein
MTHVAQRLIEVLMVEDNPGDVRLTAEAWKGSIVPIHLSVARNGEEGLAFLRRQGEHQDAPRPDLVLLDLNLPRMDGRELLAAIKQDGDLRRVPIVVLTTSNAEEDLLRCYDLHANCYIVKPVSLDRLFLVLQSVRDFWLDQVALPPS